MLIQRLFKAALLFIVLSFAGCASAPRIVDHAFGFDAINDSPDIEILNYRYGTSDRTGTRAPAWALATGQIGQAMRTRGFIQLGDTLYVKWRIRETGQVYEDTVDLKSRLPPDITDHRIHFSVKGSQLFVYLVSPEGVRRPAESPPGPIRKYSYLKTVTIYPDPFQNFQDKDSWEFLYKH